MFSGKSEELIRRLRRAQIARQRVQIFKPAVDTRYRDGSHRVAQRAADSVRAGRLGRPICWPRSSPTPRWSAIDEGQFFDAELPAACAELAGRGVRVIVAGLDQDYLGKPFEPMPQLLAVAEYITKTRAICMVCGNPANHTQRLVQSSRPRAAGRHGHLRGALPPLLRSRRSRATAGTARG